MSEEMDLFVPGSVFAFARSPFSQNLARITNSALSFTASVLIDLQASYAKSLIFYTLDGSTPSLSSPLYSTSLLITNTATLRAIAYTTDLSESAELKPITLMKGVPVSLEILPALAGLVNSTNSPPYVMNQTLTVSLNRAAQLAGTRFIGWSGSSTSTNQNLSLC